MTGYIVDVSTAAFPVPGHAACEGTKQLVLEAAVGVVSRIGVQPYIAIEGIGEVRFAYRSIKKKPNEPKPIVRVGDHVSCMLTPSAQPRAISVRILKQTAPLASLSVTVDSSSASNDDVDDDAASVPPALASVLSTPRSDENSSSIDAAFACFDPFSAPALTITAQLLF